MSLFDLTLQKLSWHIFSPGDVQGCRGLIIYWWLRGIIVVSYLHHHIPFWDVVLLHLNDQTIQEWAEIASPIFYRANLSHETFLRNARNSESTLRQEAIVRTDLSHLKGTSRLTSVDNTPGSVYQVKSTGASVSLNSAVGLLHFYCSQLPSDRFGFICLLILFIIISILSCFVLICNCTSVCASLIWSL